MKIVNLQLNIKTLHLCFQNYDQITTLLNNPTLSYDQASVWGADKTSLGGLAVIPFGFSARRKINSNIELLALHNLTDIEISTITENGFMLIELPASAYARMHKVCDDWRQLPYMFVDIPEDLQIKVIETLAAYTSDNS